MKSPKDMRIIQIDITNACMYQCSNCTRFCGHHKKNFFMDFETFKRAVNSMKGYHGTIGVMGGEPTLHPQFERFVQYLNSQLGENKKDHKALVAPQKDFIESILYENKMNSEVYGYETGLRETVVGAGLWSAMVPTYKKYYEIIQDTFKMQAVNDHGNVMYHSPILINRKDLNIPDEEWVKIRDNCWAQDTWSATITPKGAFFCEIAGALDMLFDGPGGWPIEEGWWKRSPEEFGDQLKWCEFCGIALETYTRNANDWIDDVSQSMYEKLKEIESPKIRKEGRINLVEIKDGVISEKSKKGVLEVRKELFYDNFASRFNEGKSVLYPEQMNAIINCEKEQEEAIALWLNENSRIFDNIVMISEKPTECAYDHVVFVEPTSIWGKSFSVGLRKLPEGNPIVYMDGLYKINKLALEEFSNCIINPGTLHITQLENASSDIVSNADKGIVALFHRNAKALVEAGMDFISNSKDFLQLKSKWDINKIVSFDTSVIEDTSKYRIKSGMKYAVWGAGEVGRIAYKDIYEANSTVTMYVDSDSKKWGKSIQGVEICSPEQLLEREHEYDLIIIASTFFQEIRNRLLAMGIEEERFIVHE